MTTPADRARTSRAAQQLPTPATDPVARRKTAHLMSKPPAVAPVEPLTSAREPGSAGTRVGRNGTQQDHGMGTQQTVPSDPAA